MDVRQLGCAAPDSSDWESNDVETTEQGRRHADDSAREEGLERSKG